jgi:hypothetical protein
MKTVCFLIFLSGLLFFFACEKKERTTIVSGKVINAGSKQPIDSVKVSLLDGVSTAGQIIPGNTTSGKKNITYTDKEGKFRVEITGEYVPFLSLSKKDYEAPQGGLVIGVKWGEENADKLYEMKANAWFNPVVAPKSEFSSGIICPGTYNPLYGYECGYFVKYLPKSPIKVFDRENLLGHFGWYQYGGDMYQLYKIEVIRNDVKQVLIDSVYIKSLETYNDTIYF